MSDLPKDLPEPERVIPLPDQTEPEEGEEDPAVPNAQVEGDDLSPDEAA